MSEDILSKDQQEKMAEALKSMLTQATNLIASTDLEKALEDHNKMEELKKIIGVK